MDIYHWNAGLVVTVTLGRTFYNLVFTKEVVATKQIKIIFRKKLRAIEISECLLSVQMFGNNLNESKFYSGRN